METKMMWRKEKDGELRSADGRFSIKTQFKKSRGFYLLLDNHTNEQFFGDSINQLKGEAENQARSKPAQSK
jgi:hypothetical protein